MSAKTIGSIAAQVGVGKETIRYYQRRGLIVCPPKRVGGGFRMYDMQTVERLQFIRQAQDIGFSLREIAELLSLKADPATDCSAVRIRALAKRDEVTRKLAQLERMRAALEVLIAACPGSGAIATCSILDALGRVEGAPRVRAPQPRTKTMKQIVLRIEGMHCDGCAQVIEALLGREAGVQRATVSYAGREARVLIDPVATSADKLAAAIGRAGYRVAETRR
ncbi:MAG: MerR family DNA-binding protein [Casimicrobiaceae bacterium]